MNEICIIDAYNVIHAWGNLLPNRSSILTDQDFLNMISSYADYNNIHLIVVFDGNNQNAEALKAQFSQIDLIFSSKDASADSIIEKMVQEKSDNTSISVVTSDNLERDIAMGAGARIYSPKMFLDDIRDSREKLGKHITANKNISHKKGFTIGEILGDLK